MKKKTEKENLTKDKNIIEAFRNIEKSSSNPKSKKANESPNMLLIEWQKNLLLRVYLQLWVCLYL